MSGTALSLRECGRRIKGTEFVAPVLADGLVYLRRFGHAFGLTVRPPAPGWWICQARNLRQGEVVAEALPWQRNDYLAVRRPQRLILLTPIPTPQSWLAISAAGATADEVNQGLTVIHLVEGGAPFDVVVARSDGGALWYDDLDRQADAIIGEELREALAAGLERPHLSVSPALERAYALLWRERQSLELGEGQTLWEAHLAAQDERSRQMLREWRRAQQHLLSFEKRLTRALARGGAILIAYKPARGGYLVTWQRHGVTGTTIVDEDLTVASAGFCLSGRDRDFDLTSIVDVAQGRSRIWW